MSLTMFWSVIFCAYYYVLCSKIEDWGIVKEYIQSIFFFVVLLVILQLLGKDTLLNFKESVPDVLHGKLCPVLGTIGNKMMFSSFICVLAPFLIYKPLNWVLITLLCFISWSSGAILSIMVGLTIYFWPRVPRMKVLIIVIAILIPIIFAWKTDKIKTFFGPAGRRVMWIDAGKLILKNPVGYGIGTWKVIYPLKCSDAVRKQQPGRVWSQSHNLFIQMMFELGIGIFFLFAYLFEVITRVLRHREFIKLAGLSIIGIVSLVHFPDRMSNCVLIIIMFFAYCARNGGWLSEKNI